MHVLRKDLFDVCGDRATMCLKGRRREFRYFCDARAERRFLCVDADNFSCTSNRACVRADVFEEYAGRRREHTASLSLSIW